MTQLDLLHRQMNFTTLCRHPPSTTHLAGLVELFREKIGVGKPFPVRVAVQLTFRLKEPPLKVSLGSHS